MISKTYVVNDEQDFRNQLDKLGLEFKACWNRYVWMNKTNYYRLVIFDNNEYGLFTQSQLPIVQSHQDLNSASWKDYKAYADKGYKEMRPNGVEAGTKTDKAWTSLRKQEFRKSQSWISFKENMYYWNTCSNGMIMCQDCKEYFTKENIDIHHIFPNEYDVLERSKFMLLCRNCHEIRTKKGE